MAITDYTYLIQRACSVKMLEVKTNLLQNKLKPLMRGTILQPALPANSCARRTWPYAPNRFGKRKLMDLSLSQWVGIQKFSRLSSLMKMEKQLASTKSITPWPGSTRTLKSRHLNTLPV